MGGPSLLPLLLAVLAGLADGRALDAGADGWQLAAEVGRDAAARRSLKRVASAAVAAGSLAKDADFPWATILVQSPDNGKTLRPFGCGGTLVSINCIITAGHCVTDAVGAVVKPFGVRVGMVNWNTDTPSQYEFRRVHRVVLHPQYNRASELNDVAILVLALPVTTKPVALPPAPGTPAARQSLAIRKSEMLYVAGWGATKVADWSPALRYSLVPFMPWDECDRKMRAMRVGPLPSSHICAGLGANTADACAGDSGGPLIWRRAGQPDMLVGVVSYGPTPKCGEANLNLGAYTSTNATRAWIKTVIKF